MLTTIAGGMIARTLLPLFEGVVYPPDRNVERTKEMIPPTITYSAWDCYNENEPKASLSRRNLYWFDWVHRAHSNIISLDVVEK